MQEKDEKYTALYKTQDKILEIIAKKNLGLYLTGGTALQRFHFDSYRYSDDLDFFLLNNGDSNANAKEFNEFVKSLQDNAIDFTITIKQIELTKMATFKNVTFKNDAICDDFVANFKDLINKRLTLETNLQKSPTIAHKPTPYKNRNNDNGGMEL